VSGGAAGVDGQRAPDRGQGLCGLVLIERDLRDEQVRVNQVAVDRQRTACRLQRCRRILVGQCAGDTEVRRRPLGVEINRHAEGLHRFAAVEPLEEQLAPRRLNGRILGRRRGRVGEERAGVVRAPQRTRGAGRPRQLRRGPRAVAGRCDGQQHAARVGLPPALLQEQAQLERCVSGRIHRCRR